MSQLSHLDTIQVLKVSKVTVCFCAGSSLHTLEGILFILSLMVDSSANKGTKSKMSVRIYTLFHQFELTVDPIVSG